MGVAGAIPQTEENKVGSHLARPNTLGDTDAIRKAVWMILHVENMPCINALQEYLASFSSELYTPRGSRYFYKSNYYVNRTTNTHVSCKGTSPLYAMGEAENGENILSANLYAGGATSIMVDGKEYDNIFPLWDFARVPGTTTPLETDEELEDKIPLWHNKNADNTYCKGVSHNDFGVIYQDINFNGVTGVVSRFFIEGIMIALGAGLSYNGNKQVTTTLNQCHQYDTTLTAVDDLPENSLYQGRVAYVGLDDNQLQSLSQQKEGNWKRINHNADLPAGATLFTTFIDHGVAPQNASYAYAVIPGVAPANAAERITDVTNRLTVLRNDDTVQAIRYKNKIIVVFHKAGTFYINPVNKIEAAEHSTYFLDV